MNSNHLQNLENIKGAASKVRVEYCYVGSEKTDILVAKVFDYIIKKALKNELANLSIVRYPNTDLITYPQEQGNQNNRKE